MARLQWSRIENDIRDNPKIRALGRLIKSRHAHNEFTNLITYMSAHRPDGNVSALLELDAPLLLEAACYEGKLSPREFFAALVTVQLVDERGVMSGWREFQQDALDELERREKNREAERQKKARQREEERAAADRARASVPPLSPGTVPRDRTGLSPNVPVLQDETRRDETRRDVEEPPPTPFGGAGDAVPPASSEPGGGVSPSAHDDDDDPVAHGGLALSRRFVSVPTGDRAKVWDFWVEMHAARKLPPPHLVESGCIASALERASVRELCEAIHGVAGSEYFRTRNSLPRLSFVLAKDNLASNMRRRHEKGWKEPRPRPPAPPPVLATSPAPAQDAQPAPETSSRKPGAVAELLGELRPAFMRPRDP